MLVQQHSASDARLFGNSRHRRLLESKSMPQSSPLLIISSPQRGQSQGESCEDSLGWDGGGDMLEIKELSQSPRASSRLSVFSFSPEPTHVTKASSVHSPKGSSRSSPDLQLKELSEDSSLSSPEISPHMGNNKNLTNRQRYMVINELISTESKYIDNLNTILSVFLPAFEHVVAARDLRLLIPAQLEMLVESHQDILQSLKQRMSSETKFYGFVGDIFSRLCGHSNMEFFNMYTVYMGEFRIAMKTLVSYQKDSAQFKEILSLLQQSPLCERLSLASYLLTPIQRLPRYELLLKELMKQTPVDHPDSYYIGEALNRLHKEMVKLNLSIKSCQMVCPSSNNKTSKGGTLNRRTRKARRTLSMLKRFVSTANIDDYSSGDSSFTADDLVKAPRIPRRYQTTANTSSSFCDSDIDLSTSLDSDPCTMSMFRRGTLIPSKAVSCSDLTLEFNGRKPKNHQINFHLLTPLVSEACTPNSSEHSSVVSRRHSFLYSSSSSLSSLDSNNKDHERDGSLTPTGGATGLLSPPVFFSTPAPLPLPLAVEDSKDSTLKLREVQEEEDVDAANRGVVKAERNNSTSWKKFIKRKKKRGHSSESSSQTSGSSLNGSPSEIDYAKQSDSS